MLHPGGRHGGSSVIRDAIRRPSGILLLVVAVTVGAGMAVRAVAERRPGPRAALGRLLARGAEPVRFSFRYAAGGTGVLDCVAPFRRFSVVVDAAAGSATFRTVPGGEAVAVVSPGRLWLRRSVFDAPPFTSEWATTARPPAGALAARIRLVLGVDLARYVLAPTVPASGRAVATAALATSAAVVALGADGSGRYRIVADPRGFPGSTPLPVFDVTTAPGGTVRDIVVTTRRAGGGAGPPEGGWTLVFDRTGRADRPQPSLAGAADLGAGPPANLRPARRPCRLGP